MVHWLILCAALAQASSSSAPAANAVGNPARLILPAVGADLVPLPPSLPAGLPAPIEVTEPVVGTLLPAPLDAATADLIDYCTAPARYPQVVRVAVERMREVEVISCNGRLSVERMQCQAGQVQQAADQGWTGLQVMGISIGVLAVGVLGGLVVGVVAR